MYTFFKKTTVLLITAYQYTLSPDSGIVRYLGFSKGSVCRFNPTCSEYAKQMILSRGVMGGLFLGIRQILRCHPFGK